MYILSDKERRIMGIRFMDEVEKDIKERGEIKLPDGCVTGEEFEKSLRTNKYNKSVIVEIVLYTTAIILLINMVLSFIIGLPIYYCIGNGLIGAFLCIIIRALPILFYIIR